MAKPRIVSKLVTWGIYDRFSNDSREMPRIETQTHKIPARLGIEFGYVLNIKKAKGSKVIFCIYHPPFKDDEGKVMPPFTGEMYVKTNDWEFYLGDSIWEPVEDKVGAWRMTVELACKTLACKMLACKMLADETFKVLPEDVAKGMEEEI